MLVTLTDAEVAEADSLTEKIIANGLKLNRSYRLDKAKNIGDSLQLKLDGFRAEKAASKGLGLRWNNHIFSDEEFQDKANRATDLACSLEVKATTWDNGCLLIASTDLRSATYVLVIVKGMFQYDLRGWCEGKDGMKEEFLRDGQCGQINYWVPQNKLLPIQKLINRTDSFMNFLIV